MRDTAFIQLAAWQRVYRDFAARFGLDVSGGDRSDLPGGGSKVTFDAPSGSVARAPFTVTLVAGNRISVTAGAVFWAGRCLPVIEQELNVTPGNWVVWIEMLVQAVTDGATTFTVDPDIFPAPPLPTFRLRTGILGASSSMTDHCTVTEIAGVIAQTYGTLRWPLASSTGLGVQQMWTGPLVLQMNPNGRVYSASVYPTA